MHLVKGAESWLDKALDDDEESRKAERGESRGEKGEWDEALAMRLFARSLPPSFASSPSSAQPRSRSTQGAHMPGRYVSLKKKKKNEMRKCAASLPVIK